MSNVRSLNQTRVHYNRNGDEKSDREKGESDRDPARDHSSHPSVVVIIFVSPLMVFIVLPSFSPIFAVVLLSFLVLSVSSLFFLSVFLLLLLSISLLLPCAFLAS